MNTCDILLMRGRYDTLWGWWTYIIHVVTRTEWTHVGMVLKNPIYIDKKYNDGLYILESGSEPFSEKFGVQVTKLDDMINANIYSHMSYRTLTWDTDIDIHERLKIILNVTEDKPYDINIINMLGILFKSKYMITPRKLDAFVCSTLIAFVYTELGIMAPDTNWSFFTPKNFSNKGILPLHNATLSPEKKLS